MDGIIIINKEKDWTSNDIVQKLKGIFKKKVGHTGTLDPQATGVLPILVGKGTSLSKYLINHDKEYIATIKLGKKTSTGDGEGEVNGKKLYEYARKGKQIELKPREIEIYNIELIEISKDTKEIVYKVWCSKGTYIRSLCEDISKKLETVGFMKELNRTRVGEFEINQAIKISDVENVKDLSNLKFISIEEFFKNKKSINLNEEKLIKFLNGVKVFVGLEDGIYKVYNNKEFVGVGVVKDKKIKRDIVVME